MTRAPVCTSSWVPNSFSWSWRPTSGRRMLSLVAGSAVFPTGPAVCGNLLTHGGRRAPKGGASAERGRGLGGAGAGPVPAAPWGPERECCGRERGLPGKGRGRVRCSNRVRPGGGRKRSFPLAGRPGCPLPHPRSLRVSALPETPAGSLPAHYPKVSGEGGEAEPRAAEEPGRCGTVCRPLGTGDGGAGGAGEEDRESRRAQGGKPPGIVALPQGR